MVSQPAIMTIDTTGLDEATADTVSKLKEFQEQLNTVNSLEMQQDLGIQVDTNQLDAAKAKAKNYSQNCKENQKMVHLKLHQM